jgi:hypothetical protein
MPSQRVSLELIAIFSIEKKGKKKALLETNSHRPAAASASTFSFPREGSPSIPP